MTALADLRTEGAVPRTAAREHADVRIPSLDGLRAVSFLLVFAAHAGLEDRVPGGFGVTVFFFLSGYLITTLLRREAERSGTVSLRAFYLRRAFRILPPFYAVLLAALFLAVVGVVPTNRGLAPGPLAAIFLHVGNYWFVAHGSDGVPSGTPVYWSLAVEEHFYVVFPLLFLATWRAGLTGARQARVFLALCGAVLAWRVVLVLALHAPADRTYLATDTRVDALLFGCALAVWGNPRLDAPRGPDRPWTHALFPLSLAVLVGTFTFRAPWFRETLRYTLQSVALVPVFVAAVRFPGWGPFRWLNLPLVARFGDLTYALYLVHHVVLYTLRARLPGLHPVGIAALGLALSLGLAVASRRLVEAPSARLRRRFHAA